MANNDVVNVRSLSADNIFAKTQTTVYQTNLSLIVTNMQLEGALDMKGNLINNLRRAGSGQRRRHQGVR
jgi:hypothetical protein